MIWTALPNGEIDFLNQCWSHYTGVNDELHGHGWNTVVHPEDLPDLLRRWRSAMAAGGPSELETRLRRFDDEYRRFAIRIRPLSDESGHIVKWCGINADVEDQRWGDDSQRSGESNVTSVMNAIPMTAWFTRADGYCDFVNQRWLEYTGLTEDQVWGWGWRAAIHPDCDFLNQRWLEYAGFLAKEAEGWGWVSAVHPDDMKGLAERWQAALDSGQGQAARTKYVWPACEALTPSRLHEARSTCQPE